MIVFAIDHDPMRLPKLLALEHRPDRGIEGDRVDAHYFDSLVQHPVRGLARHADMIGEVCLFILNFARPGVYQDDIERFERVLDPGQCRLYVVHADAGAFGEVAEIEAHAISEAVLDRYAFRARRVLAEMA